MPSAAVDAWIAEWTAAFDSDRRLGIDGEIPAWTVALATLKRAQAAAAEAATAATIAVADRLVFGPPPTTVHTSFATALHAALFAPEARPDVVELEWRASQLRAVGAWYDAAAAAYTNAVLAAVATARRLVAEARPTPDA